MRSLRTISLVNAHCAGEIGDVIIGGVLDVPGKTMYDKMMHFWTKEDGVRQLLLNEPRGKPSRNVNLILPPCDPRADAGFLIMESDEYAPMSGSNAICTTTVLLETGMVPMVEPTTRLNLDTAAGLVAVTADCSDGKCTAVSFDNVPAFAFALDVEIDVPELGRVKIDLAWGGMVYGIVDAARIGVDIASRNGRELVRLGELLKRAAQAQTDPVHPENPGIRGVSIFLIAGPLEDDGDGGKKSVNTVVVSPGRLDRSPCGTGTCARLAVLHARGLLKEGERFRHISVTGTEFQSHIRGVTKVGGYDAVLPTIKGSAWIYGFQQVVLDRTDPFQQGFRVGDLWDARD